MTAEVCADGHDHSLDPDARCATVEILTGCTWRPPLPPPNPLLGATVDGNPARSLA